MLRYNLLYVKVISIIVTIKNTTKKNKFSFKHNTFQNWKTEEIYMWKNEVKWQWKINRYISKHDFSCQIEIYHSICLKTSGGVVLRILYQIQVYMISLDTTSYWIDWELLSLTIIASIKMNLDEFDGFICQECIFDRTISA